MPHPQFPGGLLLCSIMLIIVNNLESAMEDVIHSNIVYVCVCVHVCICVYLCVCVRMVVSVYMYSVCMLL